MIHQRGIEPSDRPLIAALLESLPAFTSEECAVALELVDHRLAHGGGDENDYRFILGVSTSDDARGLRPAEPGSAPEPPDGGEERLAGYLCYGRTPMTRSTYDLYWIATSPDHARSGVARGLLARMEREIARDGGGLVRVETGSREGHGAAVHFYDATGFSRTARLPDFYAPGDDLLIFTKRVRGDAEADAADLSEAVLLDAAFGYRDYAAERNFLLACARRFGDREVRRVLAFASGPGRHLRAFADAGITGTGTEPSSALVDYASRLAGPLAGVRFVRAALDEEPVADPAIEPVDLSFVALSAIHQLTTPDAMERHLRIAASRLLPGGVHVIEATHPADLAPSGVHHTEWTEVRGDTTVDARFRMHIDRITPERVVPVTLEVVRTTGKKGSSTAAPRLRQEDRWFIPDMEGWRAIVARVPGLKLAAALGDFNVDVPFESIKAWRLILVLKKTA